MPLFQRLLIYLFFGLFCSQLLAQHAGKQVYTFLNLPLSARQSAWGGQHISGSGQNIMQAASNPAILSYTTQNEVALGYANLYAGLNMGTVFYAHADSTSTPWMMGLTYLNYGKFTAANQYGQITGEFTAADYAFYFSMARKISPRWSLGGTFKPILSDYERYTSFALALDAGVYYRSASGLSDLAFTIKNAGVQLLSYAGKTEPLPLLIQAAWSVKLQHAPFKFILLANNLETPVLYYSLPDENFFAGFGTEEVKIGKWQELGENIMRHMVVGIELFPDKKINILAGYNYRRRQELKLETRPYMAGFSYGVQLRLKYLNVEISRAIYHLAGKTVYLNIYMPLKI